MAVPKVRVDSVSKARVNAWLEVVARASKQVLTRASKALALQSAAPRFGRAVLFAMLKAARGSAKRARLALLLLEHLRKQLPTTLAKSGLHPRHFGFETVEELAQFMAEWVYKMETSAETLRKFSTEKRLRGLRWNIAGKALFEQLVKYHAGLHVFIMGWADEFRQTMVNENIVKYGFHKMTGGRGGTRKINSEFKKPQKVVEFRLVGDGDVRPEFTDFGALSENAVGDTLLFPVEVKMPAAMSGVKGQIASFRERLAGAKSLIAIMEDGEPKTIDIGKIVFDDNASHHIAITPFTRTRWEKAKMHLGTKGKGPFDVDPIHELKPVHNPLTNQPYYAMRVTVLRDWLEDMVKLVTEPKP